LPSERLLLVTLCCAVAAGCLMFGWRRLGCRWLGVLALVPGALLVVPTLLGSDDRPRAVAVQRLQLVAEPRQGLEPVATVRPGVLLEVLGGSEGAYVRVRAGDRSGYAPREGVAVLE
jgi:hypothetical protein